MALKLYTSNTAYRRGRFKFARDVIRRLLSICAFLVSENGRIATILLAE